MNSVIISGRLTEDPKIFNLQKGGKVARISLAVPFIHDRWNPETRKYEGGEPCFITVESYDNGLKLGTLVEKSLKKGQKVLIRGKLRLNKWKDKEGNHREKVIIVADEMELLEKAQQQSSSKQDDEMPLSSNKEAPPTPEEATSPPEGMPEM